MRKQASRDRLAFIPPQLPTLVDEPPDGDDWIHEVKYDGYRTQIIIDWDGARTYTRNGHDWTAKYWPIIAAAERLAAGSAIIDGEVIVPDANGASDFGAVRSAVTRAPEKLAFVAFDLLYLNGKDLRAMPLIERRGMLASVVHPSDGHIQFSQHVEGGGKAFFRAAEKHGLEGIVSKKARSVYMSGPSKLWLKTKCYEDKVLDVVGIQREPGKPTMAVMANQGTYAGSAFVTLRGIRERLIARVRSGEAPVKGIAKGRKVQWIEPVQGTVKTLKGEQKLRHATLREVRGDDG